MTTILNKFQIKLAALTIHVKWPTSLACSKMLPVLLRELPVAKLFIHEEVSHFGQKQLSVEQD